jgi:hypothetical protein
MLKRSENFDQLAENLNLDREEAVMAEKIDIEEAN